MTSPRRIFGCLAVAALVVSAGLADARPIAASTSAPVSVSAPRATVHFLERITFTGDATLTTDVRRVEIVIDVEGSTRSFVADVPTTVRSGAAKLTYELSSPGGAILPNTSLEARFRIVLTDGTLIPGPPSTVHYDDTRYTWQSVSGEFVTVHWTEGGAAFGRRARRIADDAIREVGALLGVEEKDPIDFFIYADRTAFYDILGPGSRENVGGEAHTDIRTLFANIGPTLIDDPWVGVVVPHELTHLVFDTAVRNPYHFPPTWLNEGLAVYLSEGYGTSDRGAVAGAVSDGTLMPLLGLDGAFPTAADRFYLAYSESVSAVSFLVDTYGRDAMVTLVRSYAAGVSDDEAFTAALGTDVTGFEAAWLESIGAVPPKPFGPVDAPAGPVPSGWGGAAPTPGAVSTPGPTPVASAEAVNGGPGSGEGSSVSPFVAIASVLAVLMATRWARRQGRPLPPR